MERIILYPNTPEFELLEKLQPMIKEQMYQAFRSLGIPTELIIYPDQFHGITNPSYQKDRFERYIAWFNKYLKK
jgi:alpha-beta hydrolase superfamily lysophospholipase